MTEQINPYGSISKLHHYINKPIGIITTKTEVGGFVKNELIVYDDNKSLELTLLLNFIIYNDGEPIHSIHTSRKYKMTRQELLDKELFIEMFKTQHSELLNIVKNDDDIKLAIGLDFTILSDHQTLEDQCLPRLEKLYSDLQS